MVDVVKVAVAVIARQRGVAIDQVIGWSREKHIVEVRHLVLWACVKVLEISTPSAGRRMGGRDHSSVLYAVNKIEARRLRDPAYCQMTEDIRTRLSAESVARRAAEDAAAAMDAAKMFRKKQLLGKTVERQVAKKLREADARLSTWTDEQLREQNEAFAAAMRGAGHG